MTASEPEAIRAALQQAKEDLLEGRVPGPLTSLRLVELANVKRHRLTHDNPDINTEFQHQARELNRTKPEVDRLRTNLDKELKRNKRLIAERDALGKRVKAYATALNNLLDENARLHETVQQHTNVTSITAERRPR